MATRILICDDHRLFREGLTCLLGGEGFEVVAETGDGHNALKLAKKLRPDVAIIEIAVPGLNGVDLTRQLRLEQSKVLVMSMGSVDRLILAALAAGASAYLLKHTDFEELVLAIQAVLKGQTYISPAIAEIVVRNFVQPSSRTFNLQSRGISIREREVLQLVAEGKSTKQIAAALYVSIKTIETHRKQIMDKVHANSIAALTKYAVREGVIFV